jgi:hypothetical protein
VDAAQVGVRGAAHVQELATDHSLDSGRPYHLADRGQNGAGLALLRAEGQTQRLGEESIAREDRHVLAERHVTGRLAAAQLVVVHGREVVVNQRVGVDHLDRRRDRKDLVGVAAERLRGRERQHRPDALAARQERVAHRLLEPRRVSARPETQALEEGVHALLQLHRISRCLHAQSRRS